MNGLRRFLIVTAALLVVLSMTVAASAGPTVHPQQALYVYDANGKRVGRVLTHERDSRILEDLQGGALSEGVVVPLSAKGIRFLVLVGRDGIFSIDAELSSPIYELPDCQGAAYIFNDPSNFQFRLSSMVLLGPPGRTAYAIVPGTSAQDVEVASSWNDPSGCFNYNSPAVSSVFPTVPLADLSIFVPPFSVR